MEVERNRNEILITGNIKSIEDSLQIKDTINAVLEQGVRNIHIKIMDSFSMTSTVIGFLMKLVNHDKIPLSMSVFDNRLYVLLEELNLLQIFNVRLVVNSNL